MAGRNNNESLSIVAGIRLFFWIILMQIVLGLPFFFLANALEGKGFSALASFSVVAREIAVNVFLLIRIRLKRGFRFDVGTKEARGLYLSMLLLMFGTRLVFDNSLGAFLARFEPSAWLYEAADEMMQIPVLGMLMISLLAPIFEEIIYRGIFVKQLLKKYNPTTAIMFSALLFSIVHLNLHQAVNAFVLGIVLGFIFYKTQSLLLCIAAHAANNLYAVLLGMTAVLQGNPPQPGVANLSRLALGICSLVLGYGLFIRKKTDSGGFAI